MTSRVIDLRLRKLEQKASQSALSHLSDAQLNAQIGETLIAMAAPYGGDVRALIEDLRASADPLDHDLAGGIEHTVDHWHEMGLPPLH